MPQTAQYLMQMQHNVSLQSFNTFGLSAMAENFIEWKSVDDAVKFTQSAEGQIMPQLILGGGSNMLLVNNVPGVVIKNNILGKEVLTETEDHVIVKVGAGEEWHRFVLWAIDQGWSGVENMSLIPGNLGAAPIQNIGAYGVELKDVFVSLEAVSLNSGELRTFTKDECDFGYRHSVFKTVLKGEYAIVSVTLQLNKQHAFNTTYGTIEAELAKMGVKELSAKAISDAVITIRQSKLPDPAELGNSGSFFKNPIIPEEQYADAKASHSSMPGYPAGDGLVKVPAGWLIEKAGWKGKRVGNCGSHEKQALVLVNYGGATGNQIFQLSERIIADVIQKFGIELEREVNIIGAE